MLCKSGVRAGVLLGLSLLALAGAPARAEVVAKEFEVMPTYFLARDTRIYGEGADFAFNVRLTERFRMGYRFEYLTARGSDKTAALVPAPVQAFGRAMFNGGEGFYRVAESSQFRTTADVGLWLGAATFASVATVGGAAVIPAQTASPFIEPMGQATFTPSPSHPGSQIKVGVGYRFIRGGPGIAGPFGAGTRRLTDLDGFDFQMGVAYSF